MQERGDERGGERAGGGGGGDPPGEEARRERGARAGDAERRVVDKMERGGERAADERARAGAFRRIA